MSEPIEDCSFPSTEEIIARFGRFRILCAGKAGVGKSSLINTAFRVDIASVSHGRPGSADIETEISHPHNSAFVMHDSRGFELGSRETMDATRNFIQSRSPQADRPDNEKLHAIWLCVLTPSAGGRIFERGDEELLKLATESKVPLIVVFTKYDKFLDRKLRKAHDDSDEKRCIQEADEEFDRVCIGELKRVSSESRTEMPSFHKVSCNDGGLISGLVSLTRRKLEGDLWKMWAIAQQASLSLKVEASLSNGLNTIRWGKYAASIPQSNEWLLEYLHKNIVPVWRFRDEDGILKCNIFCQLMIRLIQDMTNESGKPPDPFRLEDLEQVISIVTAASSALAPPVAIIGLTATMGMFVRKQHERNSQALCRCLSAYTVHLIHVLKELFQRRLPMDRARQRLGWEELKDAYDAVQRSGDLLEIHKRIRRTAKKSSWNEIESQLNSVVRDYVL